MKKCLFFFISFLTILIITSCSKNHVYVHIQNMDSTYLASSYVNTPDYRQKDPFIGQRLIVSWNIARECLKEDVEIYLTVRFFDNSQNVYKAKVERSVGSKGFYFSNKKGDVKKKILTYKVNMYTKDKVLISKWKHQFWTKLIDVDK